MAPVSATGRHCAACRETVTDFTAMTDAEVVAFLARRPDVKCGRFKETQLDRPLHAAAEPAPRWRMWLAATAALLGLRNTASEPAHAQHGQPMERPKAVASISPRETQLSFPSRALLRGQVRSVDASRLGGVTIALEPHGFSTFTEADGSFALALPAGVTDGAVLTITAAAPRCKPYQVAFVLDAAALLPLSLELPAGHTPPRRSGLLGGITAVSYVERQEPRFTAADLWEAVRRAASRNP